MSTVHIQRPSNDYSSSARWPRKVRPTSSSCGATRLMDRPAKSRTIAVRLLSMAMTGYYKTFSRPRIHRPLSMLKYDPIGKYQQRRGLVDGLRVLIQIHSEEESPVLGAKARKVNAKARAAYHRRRRCGAAGKFYVRRPSDKGSRRRTRSVKGGYLGRKCSRMGIERRKPRRRVIDRQCATNTPAEV